MSQTHKPRYTRREITRAELIASRVLHALEYWCGNEAGDDPLVCYSAHRDRGILESAEEFAGSDYPWLNNKEIELIEKSSDKVLELASEILRNEIDEKIEELEKESAN